MYFRSTIRARLALLQPFVQAFGVEFVLATLQDLDVAAREAVETDRATLLSELGHVQRRQDVFVSLFHNHRTDLNLSICIIVYGSRYVDNISVILSGSLWR